MNQPSKTRNTTMDYYDRNARGFFDTTVHLTMDHLYQPFLELIPNHGRILDAGCGSGRDSLYFKKQGYSVTAIDNSRELVKLASDLLGEDVLLMSFDEIEFCDKFDGIWACASLLHVQKSSIDEVLHGLTGALKVGGVLYASFKYGIDETIERERLFNNYTGESFSLLLNRHPSLRILRVWKTDDVRQDRKGKYWLNTLVKKQSFQDI
jgi:SAM-dependent methyltransferase